MRKEKVANEKFTEYEERLICFIDILGFKDFIENENRESVSELYELLKKLNPSGIRILLSEYLKKVDNEKLSLSINQFSDSFVISCRSNDTFSVKMLVRAIITISHILMGKLKLMLRGGIHAGSLIHDDNSVMFGPAMVEAYRLESKVASTPRIAISTDAFNIIRAAAPDTRIFIYEDTDSVLAIDTASIMKLAIIENIRAHLKLNITPIFNGTHRNINLIKRSAEQFHQKTTDEKLIASVRSKAEYLHSRFSALIKELEKSFQHTGVKVTFERKELIFKVVNHDSYQNFLAAEHAIVRSLPNPPQLYY